MNIVCGTILSLLLLLEGQFTIPQRTGATASNAAACPTLAAWKMDEGSGTVFNDISGNANTANVSVPATITWTANAIKSGVTSPFFNGGTAGTGPQDTAGSNLNFTGATPFTVAVWVNRGTSVSSTAYISDVVAPTTFNGWEIGHDTSGRATLAIISNAGTDWLIVSGTNAVPASAITYLVFTYDGSKTAAGVKIYMNATLETNVIAVNTLSASAASPNPRNFGRRPGASNPFTGPMGYLEIVGCVWNQTKISANFAGGPAIN